MSRRWEERLIPLNKYKSIRSVSLDVIFPIIVIYLQTSKSAMAVDSVSMEVSHVGGIGLWSCFGELVGGNMGMIPIIVAEGRRSFLIVRWNYQCSRWASAWTFLTLFINRGRIFFSYNHGDSFSENVVVSKKRSSWFGQFMLLHVVSKMIQILDRYVTRRNIRICRMEKGRVEYFCANLFFSSI